MSMVMQRMSMGPIPYISINVNIVTVINFDHDTNAKCERDFKLEITEKVEYKFQLLMPFKAQRKTSSYCPAFGHMMFNSSIRTGTIFIH